MGMYTELILGVSLKKDTPKEVIESIKYILGERDKPENFPLPEGRCEWLLNGCSFYFGVSGSVTSFYKESISGVWILSTRSSIKNYFNEIETFLEWLKPYIASGSGTRDMYAIVTYKEDSEPKIYYLS